MTVVVGIAGGFTGGGDGDLSGYSRCSFFNDRYIADGAKCINKQGNLINDADPCAR